MLGVEDLVQEEVCVDGYRYHVNQWCRRLSSRVPDVPQEGGHMPPTRTATRLSVNLSPEVADALGSIADEHSITITEAVRRAISIQNYVETALQQGAKILVAEPDGHVRELLFP